ncbi:MAG: hypothetical protein NVS9B15_15260 [Acidobacteriaceae bacterium]
MQGTVKDVFGSAVEADMGTSAASPAAGDWEKQVRVFGEGLGLVAGGEHEIPAALGSIRQGGEDAAADAKVSCAPVGGPLCAWKAKRYAAEVG